MSRSFLRVCECVCVCMCTCTYMSKCLQVVMVHRNSIFSFLGQHGLLGALRHGRARASSEAGSPAHLPNPAASSWSSSQPVCTSSKGRADFRRVLPWWSDDRPHRHSPVLGTFSYFGWKPVLLSCPTRQARDVLSLNCLSLGSACRSQSVCSPCQRAATLRRASWAHVPMLAC